MINKIGIIETAMASLDSIKFDLTNCELAARQPGKKLWLNPASVATLLAFSKGPPDWPFDLTDVDGARKFYGAQCASAKGAMLSLDVTTLDNFEALRGVFKYRSPVPESLAMMSVGIFWIPFDSCTFQINIEAVEQGTTGIREAAVNVMEPEKYPDPSVLDRCPWPQADPDAEPVVVTDVEDMFARMRQAPLRPLPSDDVSFDPMFPEHPLSKVRGRMKVVADTLKIDKGWFQSLKPFRR